jgi:hypothetical protein
VVNQIIKHNGQKSFKTQLTKTKEEENNIDNLTMEAAFERYYKRKNNSSYSDFFGSNIDQKFKYNNILKYKDFDHVNFI